MDSSIANPILAALLIGLVHTLAGPDHYVPFVAMARIGKWSLTRTILITIACGIGHVGSSLVVGLVGIAAGAALFTLETIESVRGSVAGWLLLGFGLAYFLWGVRRAIRNEPHSHVHAHDDGTVHRHEHGHTGEHLHVHQPAEPRVESKSSTPWVLFTIFLFGPCEPLIPLLMVPAARGDYRGVAWVAIVFSAITIVTMLLMVALLYSGAAALSLGRFQRYSHAMAGLVILCCGVAVKAGL